MAGLSITDLQQICELRRVIEGYAAALSADTVQTFRRNVCTIWQR